MNALLIMASYGAGDETAPDAAQADAATLAVALQPALMPTLQLLLQMHGTAMPGRSVLLLSRLAEEEQVAHQIAAQPGMLPALARLLQPGSLGRLDVKCAVQTLYKLATSSMAAQIVAAEPAAAAGLLAVLRAASTACASTRLSCDDAATMCNAAVALHRLAALPGSTVQLEQQPDIIAMPASLLSSSYSWGVRDTALLAVLQMVQPVPSVQAGEQVLHQLAAQPGSTPGLVQLLASTPAAEQKTVIRACYILGRLLTWSDCSDELSRQLAADGAGVAAIVRTLKCQVAECRSRVGEVFIALAQGMAG
jgi:hypothetical protein